MDEHYAKSLLSKERAFLFLSIAIVIALLTGFPDSLKIFVLGTTGTITGGASAVQPAELKDYFIGLVIFMALLVFLGYLVHALRTPRPEAWYPQLNEEEGVEVSIDKDMELDNDLERVNRELKDLRTKKEGGSPKRRSKKVTKVPDMEEIHLEHTLRNINAQLHGYKKTPTVLEAPPGKSEWDEHLAEVKQELADVDNMKIHKVKIREDIPRVTKIPNSLEQQLLARELQRLHKVLEEEQQNTSNFLIKRCIPSSREWQLAKIKKHIKKKGKVQSKEELAEIEKKLAEIYKENPN